MHDEATRRVRDIYDRNAHRYDRAMAVAERLLLEDGRAWAAGQVRGRVLDIAVGTGRNLPHYPSSARVTGIDVSERMLDEARKRSELASSQVELHVADAQHLPFPDASFDTVVATLALCTIPDDAAAVAEAARVLVPGGRLVLLEHVASPRLSVRTLQRLLNPLLVRVEGDHLLRRPEVLVTRAGLVVDVLERSKLGIMLRLVAHKPARPRGRLLEPPSSPSEQRLP